MTVVSSRSVELAWINLVSWQSAGSVAGRPNVCGLCCGLAWGCRIIRCADGRNLLAFPVNLKGLNGTICMCMNDMSMKEDGVKKIAKSCQVLPSPQEPCHKVLQQFLIQNIQNVVNSANLLCKSSNWSFCTRFDT